MKRVFAGLVTAVGLIAAIIGIYFGWTQYQASIKASKEAQPQITACMVVLSYHQTPAIDAEGEAGYAAVGHISFYLQNSGATSVTVNAVNLLLWKAGKGDIHLFPRGGNYSFPVTMAVPGYGKSTTIDLDFSSEWLTPDRWYDNPDSLLVDAFWPGGQSGDEEQPLYFDPSDNAWHGQNC